MEIGGSYATYEVITVNLKTREIGEAANVPYATILPGVAASPNGIVACGGIYRQHEVNHCQVYSSKTNEYVIVVVFLHESSPGGHPRKLLGNFTLSVLPTIGDSQA